MRNIASTLFAAIIAGSLITAPAMAAPPQTTVPGSAPASTSARILTREPKTGDVAFGTRLEGSRVYVWGAKGSLAVGLLLGPIGVAGNAAHAAKVNRSRGEQLDALVKTDVIDVLRTVREAAGTPEAARDVPAFELLPSLSVRFEDDSHFHVTCVLQVGLPGQGKRPWQVRYGVEMPGTFDSQSPASVDAAAETISPCFTEANRLFTVHAAGGMRPGPVQPATLMGKPQKRAFVAEEYPTRLIAPDAIGLMEYPASDKAE